MGNITVGTTPQPIYPDGLQDSFVIKNNGPFTVYVDNDSSINASSHAIPPTGSMAWDATRPLWMCLDPSLDPSNTSNVTIVRNSQAAEFSNKIDNVLLHTSYQAPTTTTGTVIGTLIECNAYESVQIRLTSSDLQLSTPGRLTPAQGQDYRIFVDWYDSNKNFIYTSFANSLPPWSYSAKLAQAVITFDVKGAYFSLRIAQQPATGTPQTTVDVIGSTRKLPNGMYNGLSQSTWWNLATSGVSGTAYESSLAVQFVGAANYSLYLPNLSRRLHLFIRATAGGTGTGAIGVYDAIQGNNGNYYQYQQFTTDIQEYDCTVPLYEPVRFDFQPRTTAAVWITFTWLDA